MSRAAHTPGPWSVPHFATDHPCNCRYILSDSQAGPGAIATVHHRHEADGEGNEPLDVAIANARLIAAAPELLEALDLLVRQRAHKSGSVEGASHLWDAAVAALAKATTPPASDANPASSSIASRPIEAGAAGVGEGS